MPRFKVVKMFQPTVSAAFVIEADDAEDALDLVNNRIGPELFRDEELDFAWSHSDVDVEEDDLEEPDDEEDDDLPVICRNGTGATRVVFCADCGRRLCGCDWTGK